MTELVVGDFAGGIYWHDTGPAGTVRDAVNALAEDAGGLVRRGGTVYRGSWAMPDSAQLQGLAAVDTVPGQRLLAWDSTRLWLLSPALAPSSGLNLGLSAAPVRSARPAAVGSFICLPLIGSKVAVYAGSPDLQAGGGYSAGSITTVAATGGVTGSGLNFVSAGVSPGDMLFTTGSVRLRTYHTPEVAGVIQSVDSTTHLTIDQPFDASNSGLSYLIVSVKEVAKPPALAGAQVAVASVGNRLVVLGGNRVAFSQIDNPFAFAPLDYHQLGSDGVTLGATALRDTLLWFTTDGLWTVENMGLDLVGADGTIQQQLQQVSKDLVLWGTPARGGACGVAGWEGQLVVPALDDVYVVGPGGSKVSIGAGVRPLLQFYVASGCWPGTAAVVNGHYLLPIRDDTGAQVDLLVCRLASRAAWTRWGQHARCKGLSVLSPQAGQRTELFGFGADRRVVGLTGCFLPSSAVPLDADGSDGALDVTTHDVELGPGNLNTVQRVRARYDLDSDSAAQVTASYVIDGAQTDLVPVGDSDGYQAASWWLSPVRRARRVRLRVRSSGSAATMRLRSLALTVRPSSRSS